MKIKNLLRFYYSAGSLDRALNNLIFRLAVKAGGDTYSGCEPYADRIAGLIEVKGKLAQLWARLDEIVSGMTEADGAALKKYAYARRAYNGAEKRELHRAVVKFTRRAGGLLSGGEKLYKLMCAYCCLLSPKPD